MPDKICVSCGELKPHRAKGMCSACYQYNLTGIRKTEAINTFKTCKTLQKHADDLKDDDDRLHTDFIIGQIEMHRKSKL